MRLPLMIAVITHKVDAGEVQLASTCLAPCDVKYPGSFGVRERFHLFKLGLSLKAVRVDQLLVL